MVCFNYCDGINFISPKDFIIWQIQKQKKLRNLQKTQMAVDDRLLMATVQREMKQDQRAQIAKNKAMGNSRENHLPVFPAPGLTNFSWMQ